MTLAEVLAERFDELQAQIAALGDEVSQLRKDVRDQRQAGQKLYLKPRG